MIAGLLTFALACAGPAEEAVPIKGYVEAVQDVPPPENSWANSVIPQFARWKSEVTIRYEIDHVVHHYTIVVYGGSTLKRDSQVIIKQACGSIADLG